MINDQMKLQKLLDLKETPKENELSFFLILKNEFELLKSEKIRFIIESENDVFISVKIYVQNNDVEHAFFKIFKTYKELSCLSNLMYSFNLSLSEGKNVSLAIYHPADIDEFGFIKFLKENKI